MLPSTRTGLTMPPTTPLSIIPPAVLATSTELPPSPERDLGGKNNSNINNAIKSNNKTAVIMQDVIPRLRSAARYSSFGPEALATCNSMGAIAGPHGVALWNVQRPQVPSLILSHISGSRSTSSSSSPPTTTSCLSFSGTGGHLAAARGSGVLVWDATGNSLRPLVGRLECGSLVRSISWNNDAAATATTTNTSGSGSGGTTGGNNASVAGPEHQQQYFNTSSSLTHHHHHHPRPSFIPSLFTAAGDVVSQWDLRTKPRPVLRFGNKDGDTLAQVAAAASANATHSSAVGSITMGTHLVASLTTSGMMYLYDLRMAERTSTVPSTSPRMQQQQHQRLNNHNNTAFTTWQAFTRAGVGMEYMQTENGENLWVTWGLDDNKDGCTTTSSVRSNTAMCKVWSCNPQTVGDSYWHMDDYHGGAYTTAADGETCGGVAASASAENASTIATSFLPGCSRLVAQFTTATNLACARVCRTPYFGNGIVTIGVTDHGQWTGDLWRVTASSSSSSSSNKSPSASESTRVERVASFQSDDYDYSSMSQIFGGRSLGRVRGAELAVGQLMFPSTTTATEDKLVNKDGTSAAAAAVDADNMELLLCFLTTEGYITINAIPEAAELNSVAHKGSAKSKIGPVISSSTSRPSSTHSLRSNAPGMSGLATAKVYMSEGDGSNLVGGSLAAATAARDFYKWPESRWGAVDSLGTLAATVTTTVADPFAAEERLTSAHMMDANVSSSSFYHNAFYTNSALITGNSGGGVGPAATGSKIDGIGGVGETDDPVVASIARGVEGAMMQFDMDIPVAYDDTNDADDDKTGTPTASTLTHHHHNHHQTTTGGVGGISAVGGVGGVAGVGVVVGGEQDQVVHHHQRGELSTTSPTKSTNALIHPDRARQVPCPRLCGAVFGVGGGIVTFHNGKVRQMWSWFNADRKQRSLVPSLVQSTMPGVGGSGNLEMMLSGASRSAVLSGDHNEPSRQQPQHDTSVPQTTPRTMLDLIEMNKAAQNAQWGEDIDGGGLAGSSDDEGSDDETFDEDSADGSNSSDSDGFVHLGLEPAKRKRGNSLYDNYFGDARRPVALPVVTDPNSSKSLDDAEARKSASSTPSRKAASTTIAVSERRSQEASTAPTEDLGGGPSTDPLAPVVTLTRQHDVLSLNGQCPELADAWQLGKWWIPDTSEPTASASAAPAESEKDPQTSTSLILNRASSWGWESEEETSPSSKESHGGADQQHHVDFSRNISPLKPPPTQPAKRGSPHSFTSGTAVNATRRSSKNESVIGNLKKLFNTQSPKGPFLNVPEDYSWSYDAHPDNTNVRRIASSAAIMQLSPVSAMKKRDVEPASTKKEARPQSAIGVAVRRTAVHGGHSGAIDRKLTAMHQMCLHNADGCRLVGQLAKADTWALLAEMVDNVRQDRGDEFNGWSSAGGGSLGQELVGKILKYYERQGDAQMLATIVCVLSGSRRGYNSKGKNGAEPYSLLPSNNVKYDAYIHQYAALLYGWGKLTTRAALNKHLSCPIPETVERAVPPLETKRSPQGGLFQGGIAPGWNTLSKHDSLESPSFREQSFRCSICTNTVRGLFSICLTCGHGGHMVHVMPWFAKHAVCPTGCGCSCILSSFLTPSHEEGPFNVGAFSAMQQGGGTTGSHHTILGYTSSHHEISRATIPTADPEEVPFGAYQPLPATAATRNVSFRPDDYASKNENRPSVQ